MLSMLMIYGSRLSPAQSTFKFWSRDNLPAANSCTTSTPRWRNPTKLYQRNIRVKVMLASFEKYDQSVIYMNTADYTKFAQVNYLKEKAVIEKLGLALKT